MALNAATVWEIRTTGNDNNSGGFYNRNPGTSVDYSQQNVAQLTLADLATNAAGTTLTSATGGFTAAMVGNLIHITGVGTGLTLGWYEITARADTNNVTIDRSAGASKSGGTGRVGGAVATIDSIDSIVIAGNTIYVKAGTYNIAGTIDITDGTNDARVYLIGYNITRGDEPRDDDRPLINCGVNAWLGVTYLTVQNLRFTINVTNGIIFGAMNRIINLKVDSGGQYGIQGSGNLIIDCEVFNATRYGISGGSGGIICGCYVHNIAAGQTTYAGIYLGENSCSTFNVVDTIGGDGILATTDSHTVINNVLYNCARNGVSLGDGTACPTIIYNNIFESNITGLKASTAGFVNVNDYNNFHGNGTDVTNVTKGPNSTAYDPMFRDAVNGNFKLALASQCIGAGKTIRLGVG